MIEYEMQPWYDLFGFSLLCKLSGSVFPMSVSQAAPAAALAGVVWFYCNDVDSESGTVSQAWFGFQVRAFPLPPLCPLSVNCVGSNCCVISACRAWEPSRPRPHHDSPWLATALPERRQPR